MKHSYSRQKKSIKKRKIGSFEFKYTNRNFQFEIFAVGSNFVPTNYLIIEKLQNILVKYFNLLTKHGMIFLKKSYKIPIIITRLRKCFGKYIHREKCILINRKLTPDKHTPDTNQLYPTFIHELTHFLIYDLWQYYPKFSDSLRNYYGYFHEGLACLFERMVFEEKQLDENPYFSSISDGSLRHYRFSYFLTHRCYKEPNLFDKILSGYYLQNEKRYQKINKHVQRITEIEAKSIERILYSNIDFVITSNCSDLLNSKNHAYGFYYDMKTRNAPQVSPLDEIIYSKLPTDVPVIKKPPLFRALRECSYKYLFEELQEDLYSCVVEIYNFLRKTNTRIKRKLSL